MPLDVRGPGCPGRGAGASALTGVSSPADLSAVSVVPWGGAVRVAAPSGGTACAKAGVPVARLRAAASAGAVRAIDPAAGRAVAVSSKNMMMATERRRKAPRARDRRAAFWAYLTGVAI